MGGVAVLLNTYNKAKELGWLLRHSDAQVLLTVDRHLGHDYLERLEQAVPGLADQEHERIFLESHPYLRSIWTWGDGRAAVGGARRRPRRHAASRVSDALLARVRGARSRPPTRWWSCTRRARTADPKGAIHSHGAAVRHAHNLWQMRDLIADDVLYTPMPLFWVGGFSFTLIAAMHAGATLVFEEQFEPGATLDLIERERVTQVLGWPHMAKALVDHPTFKDHDLSSIRGGSYAALLPAAHPAHGRGAPRQLARHDRDARPAHLRLQGQPAAAREGGLLRVHGARAWSTRSSTRSRCEDLPVGETGELWLRGYSLMLGLHKKERADVFTPDGWYRTGDGGYFDEDGHFYFTGRMGDLIKSAGMNITPRDVELVLEAMPEVVLAFVTGIDAGERGQDVVAAIALRPGETLDEDEARKRVKEEIASYKVPRHIAVFADQTELPWLDSGKVDRRRLTAILEERFRDT